MNFFKSLRKSLYDVSYYHHEGQAYTFWKAVWRYMRIIFIVFFVLGVIAMSIFSHFFTKENITTWTTSAKNIAVQGYPSGLVLDISAESGIVTNSTGPIVISRNTIAAIFSGQGFGKYIGSDISEKEMPRKEISRNNTTYNSSDVQKYDNILVIDTNTDEDISSYKTYALLNRTQLIIQPKANEKRVYDIASTMKGQPALHITQKSANDNIEKLASNITTNANNITATAYTILAVAMLIILFIGSFFVGLFTAIGLYFYALIVWVVSKILGTEYGYKQIYSMSVLGFTLPFVLRGANMRIKALVLCLIVGRVMYVHKKRSGKNPE